MKTLSKIAVPLLFFAAIALGAFMQAPSLLTGQVVGLQPGTTLNIVNNALAGKPFYSTFVKDNLVLFIGPTANGYGWVTLMRDMTRYQVADALTGAGGNYANGMTTSEFIKSLIDMGWTKLPCREAKLALEGSGIVGGVAWVGNKIRQWAVNNLTNKGVGK